MPSCYYSYSYSSSSITLRGPPLESETGCTGELWSKTQLEKENNIYFFSKKKLSDLKKIYFEVFLRFLDVLQIFDIFNIFLFLWIFWNFFGIFWDLKKKKWIFYFFLKLLRLLLKVIKLFFWAKDKKALVVGQSPPQELEVKSA